MPRIAFLWRRVCALGVAQIVSWGTLFYTIAVLGGAMRADTGASDLWLFGSFTAGLFLSGLVSPLVGRQIDAFGGRRVLAAGSLTGALACAVLATAQGPLSLAAGWLLAGAAMAACLYDPAFATCPATATSSCTRPVSMARAGEHRQSEEPAKCAGIASCPPVRPALPATLIPAARR